MRFVVTGEWTRNRLLMLIVWLFLGYSLVFWLTSAGLYFDAMSLDPQSVVDYYLGNEAKFTQPRTFRGMLEVSHFHFFAMGILLLTLTHLVLFVPIEQRAKLWMIALPFGSACFGEMSGWLVRFVHPAFAYLKIASFLTLQVSLLAVMALVAWALVKGRPDGAQ